MFKPKYAVSKYLSANTISIFNDIKKLDQKGLSKTVLMTIKRSAMSLSAFSSTQIEGNILPLTDVKRIIKSRPKHIKNTEREVLNYNQALLTLNKKVKLHKPLKISHSFICQIQGIVVDGLISKSYQGKYRTAPVFINDPLKQETLYLPPDAKDVQLLMTELISFVNNNIDKISPLIIAGIFHKQMVVIHPFIDGNGRTARLITKFLLAELELNTFPIFSFENYYNNNVSLYFQQVGLLGNYYAIVNQIDFTEWLNYFTKGILHEINRVISLLPKYEARLELHHKKIIKFIEKYGSITSREYAKITSRARATRIQDFKKLSTLGFIEPKGVGKATYYILKSDI